VHLALEGFSFLRNSNDTILGSSNESSTNKKVLSDSVSWAMFGGCTSTTDVGALEGADDTFVAVVSERQFALVSEFKAFGLLPLALLAIAKAASSLAFMSVPLQ
jgi:hypothetical protein